MLSRRVPLCFYCVGKYNELSTHSSLTILKEKIDIELTDLE